MSINNHKPKHINVSDVNPSRSRTKVAVQTSLDFEPQHEQRLHFYSHLSSASLQMPTGRVSRRQMETDDDIDQRSMQSARHPKQSKSQLVNTASLDRIDTIAAAGMHDLHVNMDGIVPRKQAIPEYHLPSRTQVLAKHYGNKIKQLAIATANVSARLFKALPRPHLPMPSINVQRAIIAVAIVALLAGIGLGVIALISGSDDQPSTPAATSESFERAKTQWECSLQEYEASIGKVSSTNKESSCLNQK